MRSRPSPAAVRPMCSTAWRRLCSAAEELGLSARPGAKLTLETFFGAASLARQSSETPATLRIRVTSKGGTTERALIAMDAAAIKQHLVEAVKQAAERSRELGEQLGRAD